MVIFLSSFPLLHLYLNSLWCDFDITSGQWGLVLAHFLEVSWACFLKVNGCTCNSSIVMLAETSFNGNCFEIYRNLKLSWVMNTFLLLLRRLVLSLTSTSASKFMFCDCTCMQAGSPVQNVYHVDSKICVPNMESLDAIQYQPHEI